MSSSETYNIKGQNINHQQQADATISQANPVSGTEYLVLAATSNVQIQSINCDITWAVTQPTNLRIIAVVDGQTITFVTPNPVSGTAYTLSLNNSLPADNQGLGTGLVSSSILAAQSLSGRSVQISAAITWAVTQPTPLNVRVKWAKR